MFRTEKEIMAQHDALKRTYKYFGEQEIVIQGFFKEAGLRKFVFLGCGSSYMLAKSGQCLFAMSKDTAANAVAGGDYLLNPRLYEHFVRDSIVIILSRSGKTSEIVRSAEHIKKNFGCPILSVSMEKENALLPYSDLNLVMEWAYDESVCQTRTVTNLYLALLLLLSCYKGDRALKENAGVLIEQNEAYKNQYRPLLKEIAKRDWEKAVILADGAVCGIAEEGALAFTEICRLSGSYSHVLDYRHGPMVLNDAKTLNIVLTDSEDTELTRALIHDLKERKGIIITASSEKKDVFGADLHVPLGSSGNRECLGIPFIFIPQMLAFEKAVECGCNPDIPEGLDAYITL